VYDRQVLSDYQKSLETCVPKNHRNTLKNRFSSNNGCLQTRTQKYYEAHDVRVKKLTLEEQIATKQAECKELRAQKKQLSGGRKVITKVAPGCRPKILSFSVDTSCKGNVAPLGMSLLPELEPTSSSFTPTFNSTFSADLYITPLSRPYNPILDGLFMPSSTCPPRIPWSL